MRDASTRSPSSRSSEDDEPEQSDQDFSLNASYACLPASLTKHLEELEHPLPGRPDVRVRMKQVSSLPANAAFPVRRLDTDNGQAATTTSASTGTTGTTLWLGAQVMTCYVADVLGRGDSAMNNSKSSTELETLRREQVGGEEVRRRKSVIELGGGVGYLALVLASSGYDVVTTDIMPSLETVLRPNIDRNLELQPSFPSVAVRELDWFKFEDGREWTHQLFEEYPHMSHVRQTGFDLIITTDTIYSPDLIQPLLLTLRALSLLSPASPPTLIAIEARDPTLNALAMDQARAMGFSTKRIGGTRVRKAVEKGGRWGWDKALRGEWEGVEVWKWKLERREER